jgi:hypothetical protein
MRLKQFIMDEFEFNLDLNTWGLEDQRLGQGSLLPDPQVENILNVGFLVTK